MAFLKTKDLKKEGWQKLIGCISTEIGARMIIESPESIVFDWLDKEKILPEFFRGRIFAPSGELKWRKIDDYYRCVFLGDEDLIGDRLDDFNHELKNSEPEKSSFILWGERHNMEPEWIEQVIPHRFKYPLLNGNISRGRLKLIVEEWVSKTTGEICFSRYYDLEEIEGDA